jgi:hypothetical protein
MVTRCTTCGRLFLETDARRVDDIAPRCVSCLIDETETDAAETLHAIGDALRAVAPVPVSWFHVRPRSRPR